LTIADLDTKIASQAADEDRRAHVRSAMSRLTELSSHPQSQLKRADGATKRAIIRALVQRIDYQFLLYFEQETTELSQFYLDLVRQDLGVGVAPGTGAASRSQRLFQV
jgi:hypothetical protein